MKLLPVSPESLPVPLTEAAQFKIGDGRFVVPAYKMANIERLLAQNKAALENAANGFDLLAANLLRQSDDARFGVWFKAAAQMASDGAKQIREALQS